MILAGDELDAAVARLRDGKVAVDVCGGFALGGNEACVGRGLPFIVADGGIETDACLVAAGAFEVQSDAFVLRLTRLVSEGAKEDGALFKPQHRGPLRVAHDGDSLTSHCHVSPRSLAS